MQITCTDSCTTLVNAKHIVCHVTRSVLIHNMRISGAQVGSTGAHSHDHCLLPDAT